MEEAKKKGFEGFFHQWCTSYSTNSDLLLPQRIEACVGCQGAYSTG